MRETLYLIALAATGADVVSTAFGITTLGWVRFGEVNFWIRFLWPSCGLGALVLYWPFEAAQYTVMGLAYYAIMRFAFTHTTRWRQDDYYAQRVINRLKWTPLFFVIFVPLSAAVLNLLVVKLIAG